MNCSGFLPCSHRPRARLALNTLNAPALGQEGPKLFGGSGQRPGATEVAGGEVGGRASG